MDMLTFVEAWVLSTRAFLEESGVDVRFGRSTDRSLNASCSMNLRRGALEADLMVWESGEVDLVTKDAQAAVEQRHLDSISGALDLAVLLARTLDVVGRR